MIFELQILCLKDISHAAFADVAQGKRGYISRSGLRWDRHFRLSIRAERRKRLAHLNLWFRLWQIAGDNLILESRPRVRTIAKRLVLRLAAAAQADYSASRQTERLTRRIADFKIAFNTHGTVVINRYFCSRHECRL